jgi:hypothetical protein
MPSSSLEYYMKKKLLIFKFVLFSCILVFLVSGCQNTTTSNAYVHSSQVLMEFTFEGLTYENAHEVVAIERIPDEVSFIGQARLDIPISEASGNVSASAVSEVYSIKGIDKSQAVALKIPHISSEERAYYYFKFSRKLN